MVVAWFGCQAPETKQGSPVVPPAETLAVPASPAPAIPTKAELMGNVQVSTDTAFVYLPDSICSRSGLALRREAADALIAMHRAAQADGIALTVLSATRPFGHQRSIWERKWKRPKYMGWQGVDVAKDILTYSSMPGSSRHHWGTDVDLYSLEPSAFESGVGKQTVEWLRLHAATYGYAEVYTPDSSRTGYLPEPWHWSYVPLSRPFLKAYLDSVRPSDFSSFLGSEQAGSVNIISHYVAGVDDGVR